MLWTLAHHDNHISDLTIYIYKITHVHHMISYINKDIDWIFLFSCPADSSIGDLVTHSLTQWVSETPFEKTQQQSDPRDLQPLRHLIRVMRRYDLTKKKDNDKDKDKDKDNYKDKYN